MGVLNKTLASMFAVGAIISGSVSADPLTNVTLAPGLETDVQYVDCLSVEQDQQVWDLAIDPIEGDVYIARAPQVQNDDGDNEIQANILVVSPSSLESHDFADQAACVSSGQASSREQRIIDFPSQALDFAPDGTMYFGVSTLMLGVWQRETDQFRKFTTIPNIRAVDVTPSGELYVTSGTKGVTPLFPDSILSVDRGDAFFEPVYETGNAESSLDDQFEVVTGLAVTPNGDFYAAYFPGEMVRKNADGSFELVNNRNGKGEIGGVNEAGLVSGPNGLVFHFDATTGRLFAIMPDGEVKLIAFGSDLQSSTFSQVAMDTDGNRIMFMLENGRLVEIKPSADGTLLSALESISGTGSLQGVVETPGGDPLSGITVTLQNGMTTTTDASGAFSFTGVNSGFHEVYIANPLFRSFLQVIEITDGETQDLGVVDLVSFLPASLASGLQAELVDPTETDIAGSSDVWVDANGNVFSMNFSTGTITRTSDDGEGGETTFTVARGGGLNNSFTVAVDSEGNAFASAANDGVLKLPPSETTYELVVDSNDPSIVRDQNGTNRMISLVRDVDGIGVLSDDTLVLSSGDGGEASPNFPDGTFNSPFPNTAAAVKSGASRPTNTPILFLQLLVTLNVRPLL